MLLTILAILSLITAIPLCMISSFWLLPVYLIGVFLFLLLAVTGFLLLVCALVDKDKPQEKDSQFFRLLMRLILPAVFTLARVRIHTQGLEKLPKDGRFLMVCNHTHDIDPGVLLYCFPKAQLAFIAKREIRDMPVIGSIMHRLQCQLINRENDREALKTILKCISMIKEDRASIMVFPEGYVSLDSKVRHFRSGVFKIAQKTNVPVVVCTMKGNPTVLPNLMRLKPSEVHMHLVDVISAQQVQSMSTIDLAEQVYEMMIADMGEEFRTDEKAMHPDLQRAKLGL